MSIAYLLKKSTPGSQSSINKHIQRGERLAKMIDEQFSINTPYQWQVKHLKWALVVLKNSISTSTLYDYWLTARVISFSLGKWSNWKPHLPKPKHNSSSKHGGRRPLVSHQPN